MLLPRFLGRTLVLVPLHLLVLQVVHILGAQQAAWVRYLVVHGLLYRERVVLLHARLGTVQDEPIPIVLLLHIELVHKVGLGRVRL